MWFILKCKEESRDLYMEGNEAINTSGQELRVQDSETRIFIFFKFG